MTGFNKNIPTKKLLVPWIKSNINPLIKYANAYEKPFKNHSWRVNSNPNIYPKNAINKQNNIGHLIRMFFNKYAIVP